MAERNTLVLKFGGSVLRDDESIARAAHEIYRHVRDGYAVVAVVSALHGETDALAARARAIDEEPQQHAYAALLATGELTSAALLALAVCRIGLSCEVADAARLQLRVQGRSLDAEPASVDAAALTALLSRLRVVVVPGFVGIDDNGRTALLGRGGSDFTALFLAHALGARCRLVKDVRGLYERDPARPGPLARPYASARYADALRLDGRIVQHKAVRFAERCGLVFEVGAESEDRATIVGAAATKLLPPDQDATTPLRVAILGFGTVGVGVYRRLRALPHAFEVVHIAVRCARAAADAGAPRAAITTDAVAAATSDVDVVVEAIGGTAIASDAVEAALARGRHVVTANKALLAQRGAALGDLAHAKGARLLCSAAVGGAAPVLETIERARRHGRITSIVGILNATSGFVLDRLAEGRSLDDALASARARGIAEADARRDLDGSDAADKLVLCARTAGCNAIDANHISKRAVTSCAQGQLDAARRGEGHLRLVSRWSSDGRDGDLRNTATTEPELVSASHELSFVSPDECGVLVRCEDGAEFRCGARGAGRWPTAESVLADLFDLWRESQRLRASTSTIVEACEEAVR